MWAAVNQPQVTFSTVSYKYNIKCNMFDSISQSKLQITKKIYMLSINARCKCFLHVFHMVKQFEIWSGKLARLSESQNLYDLVFRNRFFLISNAFKNMPKRKVFGYTLVQRAANDLKMKTKLLQQMSFVIKTFSLTSDQMFCLRSTKN